MPKTGTDGKNTVLILLTLFDLEKDIKTLVSLVVQKTHGSLKMRQW